MLNFGKTFAALSAAFFGVCVAPFAMVESTHAASLSEGLNQLAASSLAGLMPVMLAAASVTALAAMFSQGEESPEEIAERIANAH